ncbi:MAG: hypothetical protein RIQ86_602 [Actinomycetota bacterium]
MRKNTLKYKFIDICQERFYEEPERKIGKEFRFVDKARSRNDVNSKSNELWKRKGKLST